MLDHDDPIKERNATPSSRITVSADVHDVPGRKNSAQPRAQTVTNTNGWPSNDLDEIIEAGGSTEITR